MAVDRNRFIASAAGTFELLEVFGEQPGPLSLTTLAAKVGRPKSSVHRGLATLMGIGLVQQDAGTSHYRLTLKMWRIGMAALADLDLIKLARPDLEKLVTATDETVHLSMLDPSGDVIYISKVESDRSIRVQTQLGKLNPSYLTATGRAILAFREDVAEKVLARPLKPSTPLSIVDPKRIRAVLTDVVRKGVAITKGENHPEMGGIAAPIRDHSGACVASCGVAIPVFRMDRQLVERCTPLVIAAATTISEKLGYEVGTSPARRYGTS